ncbi:TetR/AcrR family transcriptional regulator [Microbacterium sp. KUDC0406]|uniref:TetR/AcrR family transcriptional regulator n=1 Tax=Microbacterium sp. KUDC0406 TaxID=2909588 RepID=UPI001F33A9A8|nr:TetR/AcrR family transcriptional regulator [Microbacterium sp. KUDC0406]UJP09057.1 TetR/AcrR family transcriptional regulator [Microbacterium sp. KUDC0406]
MVKTENADSGRTATKRGQITDAALALFLKQGYAKTSMDQIAAGAQVSKQTVYKQFSDKETLFRALARGVTGNSNDIIDDLSAVLAPAPETIAQLRDMVEILARRYLDAVMRPHVLALRRLLVAEADRFTDLAHEYYAWGPKRGLGLLAAAVQAWHDSGLISVDDASVAATQLAYLALGPAQDRAMFHPGWTPSAPERKKIASAAASTFLAAYAAAGGRQNHERRTS